VLGQEVVTIKHIVVPETDALLLENNPDKNLDIMYCCVMIKATLVCIKKSLFPFCKKNG
jgi:hypothetical protein